MDLKKSWKLNRIFLVCAAVCMAISIFGPYWWFVYSVDALVYLCLGFALLFIGLTVGGIPVTEAGKNLPERSFSVGEGTKCFCLALSVLSLCAFIVETANLIRYYGASFTFLGGAFYEYADDGRTFLDQVLLSVMQLGTVSYLVLRAGNAEIGKAANVLLVAGFWGIGAFALLQGSRFPVAVTFILFYVVEKRNRTSLANKVRGIPLGKKLLIVTLSILLIVAFLQLMDTKVVVNTPLTQYEIFPGDQGLKPFWYELYIATNGAIKPLYNMCDYLGEAPFVFSALWQLFPLQDFYPLSSTLRPLAKFLNAAGISIIADPGAINEAANQIARYTSFQWTLLLEYGKVGGLVASFVYGFAMAKIERHAHCNFACRVLYPCLIPMVAFAPVYFFNVGRLDWVVLESLFILSVLCFFSRGKYVNSSISSDANGVEDGRH